MDIGTQLNLMEYLRDYIDNRDNQDAVIPSNVGVNDVSLSALINKYNEMILERNRLLRTSSESNPVIIRKNSDLSAMRANIRSAINSVYKGLLISKEDIARAGRHRIIQIGKTDNGWYHHTGKGQSIGGYGVCLFLSDMF